MGMNFIISLLYEVAYFLIFRVVTQKYLFLHSLFFYNRQVLYNCLLFPSRPNRLIKYPSFSRQTNRLRMMIRKSGYRHTDRVFVAVRFFLDRKRFRTKKRKIREERKREEKNKEESKQRITITRKHMDNPTATVD